MAYTSVSVSSIHSAYDRKSGAIAYRTTISAVIAPMCAMGTSDPAGSPDATNMCAGIYPESAWEFVRLRYSLFRGNTPAKVSDVQFVSNANCQSDLEQLLVLNTSNGTSHVFNLSANQQQNRNYVI